MSLLVLPRQGQDPLDDALDVGVGHVIRRHRELAPDPTAPVSYFRYQLVRGPGVPAVLIRDIHKGRTDERLVLGMTSQAVVFLGQQPPRCGLGGSCCEEEPLPGSPQTPC